MLRCVIEDGDLPVIQVGDREFTWEEFGKMLLTYTELGNAHRLRAGR